LSAKLILGWMSFRISFVILHVCAFCHIIPESTANFFAHRQKALLK
jgi:hypothetical protein